MSNNNWQTPKWLYDSLNNEFQFKTDPCTAKDNPLNCEVFYTEVEDGLRLKWKSPVFINPPYGYIQNRINGKYEYALEKWVKEASNRCRINPDLTVVMLIPNVTPKYWYDCIWDSKEHKPYDNVQLRYEWFDQDDNTWKSLKRVKFLDSETKQPTNTPRFDSVIVIFQNKLS